MNTPGFLRFADFRKLLKEDEMQVTFGRYVSTWRLGSYSRAKLRYVNFSRSRIVRFGTVRITCFPSGVMPYQRSPRARP